MIENGGLLYVNSCALLFLPLVTSNLHCGQSNYKCIFLLAVVESPLIEKYGMNTILHPLVESVMKLESVSYHSIVNLELIMLETDLQTVVNPRIFSSIFSWLNLKIGLGI